MNSGFVFVGGVSTLCGWNWFLTGVNNLRYLRLAKASTAWPKTSGRIVTSAVTESEKFGEDERYYYQPEVNYTYDVSGKNYTGKTIAYQPYWFHRQELVQQIIAKYPVCAIIDVRYDPARPSKSVLETDFKVDKHSLVLGIIFFPLGLLVLLVGLAA